MKLNEKQADILNNMIDQMVSLQEESLSDDPYMADGVDSMISYVEEFLFELGKIDKKLF